MAVTAFCSALDAPGLPSSDARAMPNADMTLKHFSIVHLLKIRARLSQLMFQ
jgi:hypothetical protein